MTGPMGGNGSGQRTPNPSPQIWGGPGTQMNIGAMLVNQMGTNSGPGGPMMPRGDTTSPMVSIRPGTAANQMPLGPPNSQMGPVGHAGPHVTVNAAGQTPMSQLGPGGNKYGQ